MRLVRLTLLLAVAGAAAFVAPAVAEARNPRNPYSSFNLSGINYGAQRWERAQQQGRRVWPYYNTPSRNYYRGSAVSVGGVGGRGGGFGGSGIVLGGGRGGMGGVVVGGR
jgi:hypothetical protein